MYIYVCVCIKRERRPSRHHHNRSCINISSQHHHHTFNHHGTFTKTSRHHHKFQDIIIIITTNHPRTVCTKTDPTPESSPPRFGSAEGRRGGGVSHSRSVIATGASAGRVSGVGRGGGKEGAPREREQEPSTHAWPGPCVVTSRSCPPRGGVRLRGAPYVTRKSVGHTQTRVRYT